MNYPRDLANHVRDQLLLRKEDPPALNPLQELFETLYLASLKREETQQISCRVAFIRKGNPDPNPPQRIVANRWKAFPFSENIPFTVSNLVKLSKAADPWGSTLAVDLATDGTLRIWGLIDQSVHYSTYIVKETTSGPEMPGMFQATIEGVADIAAYKTYVLLGRLKQDALIKSQQAVLEYGAIREKLTPSLRAYRDKVVEQVGPEIYEKRAHWDDSLAASWIDALCRILIGIQRYGHGGAVLLLDANDGLNPKYKLAYSRLKDSLLNAAVQTVLNTDYSDTIHEQFIDSGADNLPTDLYLDESVISANLESTTDEVTGCVRFLTSLSRVDGLIWLDSGLSLNAFGVEITLKEDPPEVLLAQDPAGITVIQLDLNYFGMRHRSMMRYCAANSGSVGFVVSQDGDVRAVSWTKGRLLVWDNVRIQAVLNPKVSLLPPPSLTN